MKTHVNQNIVNHTPFVVQQSTADLNVEEKSREFAQNSLVQLYPAYVMSERTQIMQNLTLLDVYCLYNTGKAIGSGSFGNVVMNEQFPWLVVKSINNMKFNNSFHQHQTVLEILESEVSLFESYYGPNTARLMTYTYEDLCIDKDEKNKESSSFFQGKRAFIVMLKIPNYSLGQFLNVNNYSVWLEAVNGQEELSIRQMYLQLLSYLQDKGIYMYDLHTDNLLCQYQPKKHNVELGFYPIDLSSYKQVAQPYEEKLNALSFEMDELTEIRGKIEKMLNQQLNFLSFPYDLVYKKKCSSYHHLVSFLQSTEGCEDHRTKKDALSVEDKNKYELLFKDFAIKMWRFCNKLTIEEKEDKSFLQAIQYEFYSTYFFKHMMQLVEKTEMKLSHMNELMQIRYKIETLLDEPCDFLMFSVQIFNDIEHTSFDFYERYFQLYSRNHLDERIKKLSLEEREQLHQLYQRFMTLMYEFCCSFSLSEKEYYKRLPDSIERKIYDIYSDMTRLSKASKAANKVSVKQDNMLEQQSQNTSLVTKYSHVFLNDLNKKIKKILKIFHSE